MEISRATFDDVGWYCCDIHLADGRGPTYCAQVGVLGKRTCYWPIGEVGLLPQLGPYSRKTYEFVSRSRPRRGSLMEYIIPNSMANLRL